MAQKNLLLSFRKQLQPNEQSTILGSNYNFVLGLWEQENTFTIENIWSSDPKYGTSLLTKTREGIDRSEGSY
jgi:hypothetical protein